MTVLQAALLQPLDDVYDYKDYSFNEELLLNRLLKVKEIYGTNLYNFLSAMTTMNEEERQDILVFDSILNQQGIQE